MLEPFAYVQNDITLPVPGVLFGTNATCNIEGQDYIAIYDKWQDYKIRLGNSVSFQVISSDLLLERQVGHGLIQIQEIGDFARIKHGFD